VTESLRFAMVTTFYPPYNFGGDGIGVQRLSHALARAGHEVTVIHDTDAYLALARGEPQVETTQPQGVEVVRLRSGLGPVGPLLVQQAGRPVLHARRLDRLLNHGDFDVVNFHNVSLIGGPGLFAYGGDAVRLYLAHEHWLVCPTHVLWRHGREPCPARECLRCTLHHRRPPQAWRHTGHLERQAGHIDAFIAQSEFSRCKHREFGFQPEMDVLPQFLPDLPPHPRPYFLFVGRLERIKGLDDVIPAFESYGDADLVVAGDGEHGPALRQLAGGNPHVRFLGRVTADDLHRWYRHAIALIVPSVCYETFGITLIEAFRQHTPVIARRIGPFPEIVERAGAGALFDSIEQMLAAMRRLQADPTLRDEYARAGHAAFRAHWSERAVLPRYLDIVRRAAQRRQHARVAAALASTDAARAAAESVDA
jgi:glycosyltransferase involved in cell wall biosynthesis